jgi:hypothetical protein
LGIQPGLFALFPLAYALKMTLGAAPVEKLGHLGVEVRLGLG